MSAEKKNVKVALTFDFDTCCVWIGTLGATSPSMISRGEFVLRRVAASSRCSTDLAFNARSSCLATPRSPFPSPRG